MMLSMASNMTYDEKFKASERVEFQFQHILVNFKFCSFYLFQIASKKF